MDGVDKAKHSRGEDGVCEAIHISCNSVGGDDGDTGDEADDDV